MASLVSRYKEEIIKLSDESNFVNGFHTSPHVTSFFFSEILASSIRSSTAVPVRFFPQHFAMYYKSTPSYFMIFQSAQSNAKFSLFLHQYKAASRQHFSWIAGLIQFDWKSMDCNSGHPTLRQQLFFDLISANPCCPIQFPCIYCHRLSSFHTYIGYNNILHTARAREKYNLLYI